VLTLSKAKSSFLGRKHERVTVLGLNTCSFNGSLECSIKLSRAFQFLNVCFLRTRNFLPALHIFYARQVSLPSVTFGNLRQLFSSYAKSFLVRHSFSAKGTYPYGIIVAYGICRTAILPRTNKPDRTLYDPEKRLK